MSLTHGSARPTPPLLLGRLLFFFFFGRWGGGGPLVADPSFPSEALQPLGTVSCSAGHAEVHRSKRNFLQDYT